MSRYASNNDQHHQQQNPYDTHSPTSSSNARFGSSPLQNDSSSSHQQYSPHDDVNMPDATYASPSVDHSVRTGSPSPGRTAQSGGGFASGRPSYETAGGSSDGHNAYMGGPSGAHGAINPAPSRGSFMSSTWNGSATSLIPPSAPFAGATTSRPNSIHFLPSKFSSPHKQGGDHLIKRPKAGGGRAAFGRNEARMPQEATVDSNGKVHKPKLKWNRFKWLLFIANTILLLYSIVGLIALLLVWFNALENSDILRVGNRTPLAISTAAASLCLFTSLLGYAGIILNNRTFLAIYTLFLWFCFALIVTPGYITYKNFAFNLEGKINRQWSRDLGEQGRLKIQNQLNCCGYFSPFVEATISSTCYARSNLPGCKGKYLRQQRVVLKRWYICAFALVPVQLAIMIIALLSSNQVTYRFGKGLTPKQYRLDLGSLAYIMDGYAGEIAAAYGPNLAAEAITRSSSNLDLLQRSNHRGASSGFNSPKMPGSPYGSKANLPGEAGEYAMSTLGRGDPIDADGNAGGKKKKGSWYLGGK